MNLCVLLKLFPGTFVCSKHQICLLTHASLLTAREASKRIVEDLLLTAGMDDGLDEAEGEGEGSPSIIKPTGGLLEEDTF